MRLSFFTLILLFFFTKCTEPVQTNFASYDDYPVYDGDDLGMTYSDDKTTFKLWSPAAEAARLDLYYEDLDEPAYKSFQMQRGKNGVWEHTEKRDLAGMYYTYTVTIGGQEGEPTADPYAVAAGRNGVRSQVIDLAKTNPLNWEKDESPRVESPNDMIIYELHIRDMSIDPNSGISNKGKYLGLAETRTATPDGIATGIAHLQKTGITHVHILPSFDFFSVDESKPASERGYNWGYDPHLYNVPEGSYSTDPANGAVRVKEYKEMVKALHDAGIGVIMDVVYNHTGRTEESVFNRLVPEYYYRHREDGSFSDAAACGNETASERPMVRNFIVNSVKYWTREYHIDGFRFDLMGIHDLETMNIITDELKKINPDVFVYGEGWTAGSSPLPDSLRALKSNVPQLKSVAAFSDEIRDALKGHVFTAEAKGFISGLANITESIKFGTVGGTQHPQIEYDSVNYTNFAWAPQPTQCIVYASCHDNHTIWDRLLNSIPEANDAQREKMQQLALGVVLTAQGVPFMHAGSEFCRTKQGEENSYKSPDTINLMDWNRVAQFPETVEFVREMIALRKGHPAFRMRTTEDIQNNLTFSDFEQDNLVGYRLNGKAAGDSWEDIYVVYNGNLTSQNVVLPAGKWSVKVKGNEVDEHGIAGLRSGKVSVPASGMMLLVRDAKKSISF